MCWGRINIHIKMTFSVGSLLTHDYVITMSARPTVGSRRTKSRRAQQRQPKAHTDPGQQRLIVLFCMDVCDAARSITTMMQLYAARY